MCMCMYTLLNGVCCKFSIFLDGVWRCMLASFLEMVACGVCAFLGIIY